MSDPYIGEIRIFAGSYVPAGWAACDGSPVAIAENDALFVLIGTTYGGDGESTFNLPDLRGRLPVHQNSNYPMGQQSGVETVTLTTQQIPVHTHAFLVSGNPGTQTNPANNMLGPNFAVQLYRPGAAGQSFDPGTITPVGGSQPHENMQPYGVLRYIISLYGIFPQFS
jgi:microcystin-dependent protein